MNRYWSLLQPSSGQRCHKFQTFVCLRVYMCCVYIKEDAAVHTCTSRHWLGLSLSSPLSSLTPAVPSHDPLESRDGPIVLCYAICTYWHLISSVPPHLIMRRLWYTADTERSRRALHSMYAFLQTVRRKHDRKDEPSKSLSYVKRETFLFWCSVSFLIPSPRFIWLFHSAPVYVFFFFFFFHDCVVFSLPVLSKMETESTEEERK